MEELPIFLVIAGKRANFGRANSKGNVRDVCHFRLQNAIPICAVKPASHKTGDPRATTQLASGGDMKANMASEGYRQSPSEPP